MTRGWSAAIFAAVILLGAGLVRLAASPPRGPAVTLIPPPTADLLAVHVAGAVAQPGVYYLPSGSRVRDAVEAAGGFTAAADPASVNLAEVLQDGNQIVISNQGQTGGPKAEKRDPDQAASPLPTVVDVNKALQAELETLPGIGPVTAQKIIAYRQEHGSFTSIEELLDVPGIGPAIFERIKNLVTVEEPSPADSP